MMVWKWSRQVATSGFGRDSFSLSLVEVRANPTPKRVPATRQGHWDEQGQLRVKCRCDFGPQVRIQCKGVCTFVLIEKSTARRWKTSISSLTLSLSSIINVHSECFPRSRPIYETARGKEQKEKVTVEITLYHVIQRFCFPLHICRPSLVKLV